MCLLLVVNSFNAFNLNHHQHITRWIGNNRKNQLYMTSTDNSPDTEIEKKNTNDVTIKNYIANSIMDDDDDDDNDDPWEGHMEGFDWEMELLRRNLKNNSYVPPGFAPFRMTIWEPEITTASQPSILDGMKIIGGNLLQLAGISNSYDGAPLVHGLANFTVDDPLDFAGRIFDGNLTALAGGPLFLLLEKYYQNYGPVFKLAFGPKSFMVVSDPVIVKHILKENSKNYDKGLLAEILEPIMGNGLIPAKPEIWKIRRRAIVPGFHKAWLNAMMKLFVNCNGPLLKKLDNAAETGNTLNMETEFCSVSLDIIGKAVFNYDFGSVNNESPVVKAVYAALQEAERRSTSFIPYWNIPYAEKFMDSLKSFHDNMNLLDDVLNELIEKALETQEDIEEEDLQNRDYDTMENPSLLRFLVDMRGEESSSKQLRDDLMTMLVAGHETTAAVLTWTMFELSQQPKLYAEVRAEIDLVLGDREPGYDDLMKLNLVRLCLAETLRMYPEPPLLIRRALDDDVFPAGGAGHETIIPKGTDVFISTWNMHRSPDFWEEPTKYNPYRFMKPFHNPSQKDWAGYKPSEQNRMYPTELQSDFAFMPFGGGNRKCVGDQFAMMESIATLSLILQKFDLKLASSPDDVGMRTGATIHTENGLPMLVTKRRS